MDQFLCMYTAQTPRETKIHYLLMPYDRYMPSGPAFTFISQTVPNLIPGTAYTASVDLLPYMNPVFPVGEECGSYFLHTIDLSDHGVHHHHKLKR